MPGIVKGTPKVLLRLEGLFVMIAAAAAFLRVGASWWLFALLFFAPDLSMLGYLAGNKAGTVLYNTFHWYALPIVTMACGVFGQAPLALAIGLIWAAHIGFDRALGYGLKYPEAFGATHLGLKGKSRK